VLCAVKRPIAANGHYEGETLSLRPKQKTEKEQKKMEKQTQTTDIPKGSALLVEAVNKPGLIMKAYTAFWTYSVGNQILALVQCQLRGIQPARLTRFRSGRP
jgi:hypothetical protein